MEGAGLSQSNTNHLRLEFKTEKLMNTLQVEVATGNRL